MVHQRCWHHSLYTYGIVRITCSAVPSPTTTLTLLCPLKQRCNQSSQARRRSDHQALWDSH